MAIPISSADVYLFVVDTDKYAGNFERQMCAYMTGVYGECEIGKDEADLFEKEIKGSTLDVFGGDLISSVPDEHGCYRPVTIMHSQDHQYNSVGIFMSEKPNAKEVALLVQRARKFVNKHIKQHYDHTKNIKILGFRFLIKKTIVETDSKWDANGEYDASGDIFPQ